MRGARIHNLKNIDVHLSRNALGADTLFNSRLIVNGRIVRRLYNTIFRLHQQVLFGWAQVTSLIVRRRMHRWSAAGSAASSAGMRARTTAMRRYRAATSARGPGN